MPTQKIKEFLDSNRIKYRTITHSRAYTAQEIAAAAHVPGDRLAKTVIVKIDGEMAMAVLPASHHLVADALKTTANANELEIASEDEFAARFPECEPGAMPPFGNLYGMPVWVAEALAASDRIAFNSGTHSEAIELAYSDFERLVQPRTGAFSAHNP